MGLLQLRITEFSILVSLIALLLLGKLYLQGQLTYFLMVSINSKSSVYVV